MDEMAKKRANKKLYVIGIDAGAGWIIHDFRKKRRLGGFEKFMESGAFTDLESTLPPMTGPSWPSIYTGFRPGMHGVPEFLRMEPNYTKTVVFYDPNVREPFWTKLSRHGIKSLVMTPAMLVRPQEDRNVDMITGFPLPARFNSEAMKKAAARYHYTGEPDIEQQIKSESITLRQASKKYLEAIETRAKLSKELIKKNDYDLSFVCFTETDRMGHFSLNKPEWADCMLPLYEGISDFLLWAHERAEKEDATVMVLSDHGEQPIHKKFLMNGWLINNGYAKPKQAIESGLKGESSGTMKYQLRESLLKSKLRKRVYDKLPSFGKKIVKGAISATLTGTSSEDYTRLHDFDYDMEHTVAFASIANCPVTTIYINDDRFEKGTVKRHEKPALKRRLMAELKGIKDEDGKPLVVNVFDADDYYEDTKLFIAPDVMAEIKEGYIMDAFGYQKSGKLFMKPEMAKSGDHLREGIFGVVGYGSKLDYGAIKKRKLYVYNIEPTITSYFGVDPENDTRYGPIF
ncbi:MAG: alkaline phosphatase family protein [Candidatus Micrarchaeota archaeon]|nr:alkaline phosphatase family protein [Candidatus Micrarchaeota archaeon]